MSSNDFIQIISDPTPVTCHGSPFCESDRVGFQGGKFILQCGPRMVSVFITIFVGPLKRQLFLNQLNIGVPYALTSLTCF